MRLSRKRSSGLCDQPASRPHWLPCASWGGSARAPYPGAETTARTWAEKDGCGATSSPLDVHLDLDKTLSTDGDPADTWIEAWSGCDGGSSVQLWTIQGAEHGVKLTPSYADALLAFVAEHPKP